MFGLNNIKTELSAKSKKAASFVFIAFLLRNFSKLRGIFVGWKIETHSLRFDGKSSD